MTLELRAPEIAYVQGTAVLRNVSLQVRTCEAVAVLGGNGSGKSALLRWMCGALPMCGGQLRVNGQPVESVRDAVNARVGLLLQDPNDQLLGGTVAEDVGLGPRNLGLPAALCAERVGEALRAVGMEHAAREAVESLSLGQKKRVALAGVLAMQPSVLLLDEPTAGLDPAAEARLTESLLALVAQGMSLVIATHAMDWVPQLATRAIVLAQGRVIADGPLRAVLDEPALLEQAQLRRPWPLLLRARGGLPHVTQPPLTMEEVLQCLNPRSC